MEHRLIKAPTYYGSDRRSLVDAQERVRNIVRLFDTKVISMTDTELCLVSAVIVASAVHGKEEVRRNSRAYVELRGNPPQVFVKTNEEQGFMRWDPLGEKPASKAQSHILLYCFPGGECTMVTRWYDGAKGYVQWQTRVTILSELLLSTFTHPNQQRSIVMACVKAFTEAYREELLWA